MASKFGLAGGMPERRVRPVWDAIDSRQFKNALKLVTALLTKYPNSPYALALKALVLERLGKLDEALSVCLTAKELLYSDDSVLVDDHTLSTLQIVFLRLDHLHLATSCYERACVKFPNNMELMTGLFNCYVREYSFVKQQQTAIKMYKLVGEERFLLWAVCSIQLQVLFGNGGEKLLVLAEGLLKKHVASHSLHEPEALMVYISILEQQAKYGDALELLSGKLGSLLIVEVDNLSIKGRLLARLGDYAAAANIFQRILEICPDEWDYFLQYLSCLLEDDSIWCSRPKNDQIHPPRCLSCNISHLSDEVFDSRMSDASAFVQKLMEDTNNGFVRCPYLANIEIERRKQLHGKGDDSKVMEALTKYYARFGYLASFTSDIEMFLDILTSEKKVTFIEMLKRCSDCRSTVPTKILGHSISLFKIQELIQNTFKLPVGEVEDSAVQMVDMYSKNLSLSKDLDPQENIHGEDLLSMACNALIQLFWRSGNFGYFIEAVMVVEFGLTIRRYTSQYKILLLHLYSHLGVLSLAHERFKSLDVKNILMETLYHHILPQTLVSPFWMDLSNLLQDYLKFMNDHLRESAEFTFLAYHHRNYSKVIEFVQFKEQLQLSNQYLMAKVEASILKLKQNADNIEDEEAVLGSLNFGADLLELSNEIGSKSLSFNEDFQSRPWWTPSSERNYLLGPFEGISYCSREDLVKEREANVRRAIEWKSLLPRMIFLSIQSASTLVSENFEVNGPVSDCKASPELKILLECYTKSLGFSFSDAIGIVLEIFDGKKSSEVFGSDLINWLNLAVFLDSWSLGSHELVKADQARPSNVAGSLLEKCILEIISSTEPAVFSPLHNLSILVQLISEPLAWHGLVIQSRIRSLLPPGKKKKKTGHADASALSHMRDSVNTFGAIVEKVMNWIKEQINVSEDESVELVLSSVRKKGEEGPGRVFQILETMPTSISDTEVGDQISQALKSWNSVDVARKLVAGKCTVLTQFLHICESKFKLFQALKRKITNV